MTSAPVRSRGSLVGAVVIVATLELLIKRVVIPLAHVNLWPAQSKLRWVFDHAGRFSSDALSVLSIAVLLAGIIFIAARGTEFRAVQRGSFPLMGFFFVLLASLAIVRRLPPGFHVYLRSTYVFLTMLFVVATLPTRVMVRAKLGVVFVYTGVLLALWPRLMAELPLPFVVTPEGADALTLASFACFTLGGTALVPSGGVGRPLLSGGLTVLVVVCAATVMVADWEVARAVALYAYGVDLPMLRWGQLLAVVALGSMLHATLRLLFTPGVRRLRGLGLALIALGGVGLDAPAELATSALGFLCIAASMARSDGAPMAWPVFEALVRKLAAAVGAPTVTLTGPRGGETVAAHAPTGGTPMSVRLERQAGAVAAVEICFGETPSREPTVVIADRASRRLGPSRAEPPAPTGDADFDARFVVQDPRGAGVQLLDDETRKRLGALAVGGWLGVWPERALVYRAARLPDGEDGLVTLVGLLRELAAPRPTSA